jgi:enediyne polyketide synthase
MPDKLLLGDPAARDAAIHSLQACIPHVSVLPIAVDRLTIGMAAEPGARLVSARERERRGNTLVYDLIVTDERGHLLEQWDGLTLQAIDTRAPERPWAEPLFGPYLERRIQELVPGVVPAIALERSSGKRRARSDQAIQRAIGISTSVWRRPDGRPEIPSRPEVSLSTAHADGLTLAIASRTPVGCDLEIVTTRSADCWRDLLGRERFALAMLVAREANVDIATAATRVWATVESVKKAGASDTQLTFDAYTDDGWVTIAAGSQICATCSVLVRGTPERLVTAVFVQGAPDADL